MARLPLAASMFSALPAPAPAPVWDRLRRVAEVEAKALKKATTPADKRLMRSALDMPADALIPKGPPERKYQVPLRGSIHRYVAAVVGDPRKPNPALDTWIGFVPCFQRSSDRCVAIVGDPCKRPEFAATGECEGMYLTVTIDVTTTPPSLDRIDAGGYLCKDQIDIEEMRAEAP